MKALQQCKEIGNQFCCRVPELVPWLVKVTPKLALGITLVVSNHSLCKARSSLQGQDSCADHIPHQE